MAYKTIFFDLDDTLYDKDSGVWSVVRERIEGYMHERVGLSLAEIPTKRQGYLQDYGTTLRGLTIDYQIDPDDYLVYVHEVPIEDMIRPNLALAEMLEQLPQRKWIFTNASLAHARRVLSALGISDHFEGILDIKAFGYRNKPDAGVYTYGLERAGETNALQSLFLDDISANLAPAKQLGAGTVLVGSREPHPVADHSIMRVEELLSVLPALVE
jgi:putative hydrolase of the HAD superfamily